MGDTSDDDVTLVALSALLLGYGIKFREGRKKKRRKQRTVWVKPWISRRDELGAYNALINEMAMTDREDYRRFMRMNTETFTELIEKLRSYITKRTTIMRKPISPEEKLAVTLRFLATGESFESLSFLFRIHHSTIAEFLPVCH